MAERPPLSMQLVTRDYTDRVMRDAVDAIARADAGVAKINQAIAGTDASVAQNVKSGAKTREELAAFVQSWFAGAGALTSASLDSSVEALVKASSTRTYGAIASMISQLAPSGPSTVPPPVTGGGGTTVVSSSPRFYVEDYRKSGMSDDAAVRATIQAAARVSATFEHPIVEFAARRYDVTHGVFSDIGAVVQAGMTFVGQGYTTLRLLTQGKADQWFYDNGSSAGSSGNDAKDNRRLAFASWENINFTTDDASRTNGNGFRFTGIGLAFEQNYTFTHCRFSLFDVCMATAGTLNTDSIRLYSCYGDNVNTAMRLNNNQSVELEWHGTTFELIRKDAIVVATGGGGDVKILGGSWVMEKAAGDTGTYAFVRVAATDNTAWGNGNFAFTGIKTELRDADTMLADVPGPAGAVYMSFVDCNLHTAHAQRHAMVRLGSNRRVSFMRCQLPEGALYVIDAGWEAQSGPPPMLTFTECETPADLAAMIQWKQQRFGTAHGRHNREIGSRGDYVSGYASAFVEDFDLNVLNGGLRAPTADRKIVPLFATGQYSWPCDPSAGGVTDWRLVMPPGALITRVVLSRPAAGSSQTPYQLAVTSGDRSVTYASSNASGTFGGALTLDATPNVTITNDATNINARTLRLSALKPGDAQGVQGGFAYVEYI